MFCYFKKEPSHSTSRRTETNAEKEVNSECATEDNMTGPNLDTLGSLSRLPPEVRLMVFKLLLPENFRQVYQVTDDAIALDRKSSSPNPRFLWISKQVHDEIVQSMMTDTTCRVRIESDKITTNFIDSFRTVQNSKARAAAFQLPACNLLDVTIIPPFPRSAEAFVHTRRNVHLFVEALNNARCDIIPKMSVRLEHQECGGGFRCDYNDFSMLMGPLYKLHKPCRAVMIYRTNGYFSFASKIEVQCDTIEKALGGSEEARRVFDFQQCMLDIKLPLCMFNPPQPISFLFGQQLAPAVLDAASASTILRGCAGLLNWYLKQDQSKPDWLDAVADELLIGGTPSRTLIEQIFEGHAAGTMQFWASGLMTPINPFWKE